MLNNPGAPADVVTVGIDGLLRGEFAVAAVVPGVERAFFQRDAEVVIVDGQLSAAGPALRSAHHVMHLAFTGHVVDDDHRFDGWIFVSSVWLRTECIARDC